MKAVPRIQIAFGEALRRLRVAAGISQEELAARAGLHRTYVGDIERGERNVSIINIHKLAVGLGIRFRDLAKEVERHLEETE